MELYCKIIFWAFIGYVTVSVVDYLRNYIRNRKKKFVCHNVFVMEIRGRIVTQSFVEVIHAKNEDEAIEIFNDGVDEFNMSNAVAGDVYCIKVN